MIKNIGSYYLYRHIRLDTGEPFYVGIGTKNKKHITVKSEYKRAYCKHYENSIWKNIVSKTEYEVEILLESNDYEFIKQKEIEFIALYGRKNLNRGILCNLTDGGEGVTGKVHTDEWKKNHSNKMKGRQGLKGASHPNYGIPLSEDIKRKISESQKGRIFSDEHKFNISKALLENNSLKGENNPMFGKKCGDSTRAIKVIDILSLRIFECKIEAAESIGVKPETLSGYLSRKNPNKTNIRLLIDVEKEFENLSNIFNINITSIQDLSKINTTKEYVDFWAYYPGNKPIKREKFTEEVVKELILEYSSISDLRTRNLLLYRLIQNKFSHLIDHLRNKTNS